MSAPKALARVVALGLFLVLALGGPALAAGTTNVTIQGFAFNPATVNVTAGDTVVWTNDDGVAHNVSGGVSSAGNFLGTFSHTFNTPGTFEYFCSLHGSMTGSVTVAAGPVVPEVPMNVLLPLSAVALGGVALAARRRLITN